MRGGKEVVTEILDERLLKFICQELQTFASLPWKTDEPYMTCSKILDHLRTNAVVQVVLALGLLLFVDFKKKNIVMYL